MRFDFQFIHQISLTMRKLFWIGGIIILILISIACAIVIPILIGEFIWLPLIITLGIETGVGIIIEEGFYMSGEDENE